MKWQDIMKENIEKALKDGLVRQECIPADPDQGLTYILTEKKFFHHKTLESANAERYFLQAALGQRYRMMKIWNTGRQQIRDDFSLLRGMLSETEHWDEAYYALDRILKGAGY